MSDGPFVVIGSGRFRDDQAESKGGDQDTYVPSKVMEASIKRHCPNAEVVNTHDMDKPQLAQGGRERNRTPFSLVRLWVPQLAAEAGRDGYAVYVDADQIVYDDIGKLIEWCRETPFDVWIATGKQCSGVCVFDVERCAGLNAFEIAERIDRGGITYRRAIVEFMGLSVGEFPCYWNDRDTSPPFVLDRGIRQGMTKLLHFTQLATQPWKPQRRPHPLEWAWADALRYALETGYLLDSDLDDTCRGVLERNAASTEASGTGARGT